MKVKQAVFAPIDNNCYLIIDEKTNKSALVDCSEYNVKTEELIGDTELEYILLTHGHFDHIGGVKKVRERYGAKVVISYGDAPMLSDKRLSMAVYQENVIPDILVKDGDIIKLGELEIKVIATPGHTKGGVCFLVGDSLFTGDTLFCRSCGRCDFEGGDEYEMLSSLRKLRALEGDYKVYPGHDSLTTLEAERKYNPYMNM